MAVNDVERDKAIALANYIHCSVHEWPTEDDVPLLCYALLHEVDQTGVLRAELAAAKEQRGQLEALIVDAHFRAFGSRHYAYVDPRSACDLLVADITATQHERDAATARAEKADATALKAHVERLREPLDLYYQHEQISNDAMAWVGPQSVATRAKAKELWFSFRNAALAALAATPAQSLAAVKAEALREAAKECQNATDWCESELQGRQAIIDRVSDMAERLEADAARAADGGKG